MSAAILSKFLEVLGIEDQEPEEENQVEYEEVEDAVTYERPARAGYFSKSETRRSYEENTEPKAKLQTKVLPMTGTVATSKVVITQPEAFEDVEEIGEYLKQRRSVIVNLESINKEDGKRVLDFLGGASFALEGNIQKVSNLIYLITPTSVEIQNDVERAQYRNKLSFSWLK